MALRGRHIAVELQKNGTRAGERFSHSFDNAVAYAELPGALKAAARA
jgi:hypothetical protein